MAGVPPERVYKTLVMLRSHGRPLLVMVPGGAEVDTRRLASSLGAKTVMEPMQVDPTTHIAAFVDPQGNMFGLYSTGS